MQEDYSTSIHVDAPPEEVYDLVSDITRMGEWSPECVGGEWRDGATGPAPGAKFQGFNKVGEFEWEAPCEVRRAERGRVFEFAVGVPDSNATIWTFTFEADGDGTLVTESFHAPLLNVEGSVSASIPGRDEMLQEGCRKTLENLKAAVEARP